MHTYQKTATDHSPLIIFPSLTQFRLTKGMDTMYYIFDGIFIVPTSGTYVFTWSFMADSHGNVNTELMKNADIIGTRFADSSLIPVWDFSTGIVVSDVVQGDQVYVRLGHTSGGNVMSVSSSRTTFSGWLLN